MDKLQSEIETKQQEGVDFVHLQRRLESACAMIVNTAFEITLVAFA